MKVLNLLRYRLLVTLLIRLTKMRRKKSAPESLLAGYRRVRLILPPPFIKAQFYGYLKKLKATGKGVKPKQRFEAAHQPMLRFKL